MNVASCSETIEIFGFINVPAYTNKKFSYCKKIKLAKRKRAKHIKSVYQQR